MWLERLELIMEKLGTILTHEYLKSILNYDPDTGVFSWKVRKASWINVGDEAGRKDKDGYLRICIDGREYRSHRLAWFYVHGVCPEYVDHINPDGPRSDNRICNLRPATQSENSHNKLGSIKTTTGFKGVNFHKREKKWRATIKKNRKQHHLGYFNTPEDAAAAYQIAASKFYGQHARW